METIKRQLATIISLLEKQPFHYTQADSTLKQPQQAVEQLPKWNGYQAPPKQAVEQPENLRDLNHKNFVALINSKYTVGTLEWSSFSGYMELRHGDNYIPLTENTLKEALSNNNIHFFQLLPDEGKQTEPTEKGASKEFDQGFQNGYNEGYRTGKSEVASDTAIEQLTQFAKSEQPITLKLRSAIDKWEDYKHEEIDSPINVRYLQLWKMLDEIFTASQGLPVQEPVEVVPKELMDAFEKWNNLPPRFVKEDYLELRDCKEFISTIVPIIQKYPTVEVLTPQAKAVIDAAVYYEKNRRDAYPIINAVLDYKKSLQ